MDILAPTRPVLAPTAAQFDTPHWLPDAVFYQIFPDRFARSNAIPKPGGLERWDSAPTQCGFKGGDLVGVTEQLDYLTDLGITALYLCPIFRSAANHRYHTHDYYEVDTILGGNQALAALLQQAHHRGMRVVIDGVFNHASRGFLQFNSVLENGAQSPYFDWFTVHSWPLHPYPTVGDAPGYACWVDLPALPEFNLTNPTVREFLLRVGEYWIEQGVDGWRLDVACEIDDDFWREFRRRIKRIDPDAYIVGEIWVDAGRWLEGDQFDGVMNYLFAEACLGFFGPSGNGVDETMIAQTALPAVQAVDAQGFRTAIEALLRLYPWTATLAQLNMLNTHDTARFITMCRDDESAFRLATLFQMTYPGAPCVYYGDEIGLQGGPDPDNRRAFPWDASQWDHDRRAFIKRCIRLRHEHAVLRRGEYISLRADEKLYVFARQLGDEIAIVGLNAGSTARCIDIPKVRGRSMLGAQAVWDNTLPAGAEEGGRMWTLQPRSGDVLLGHFTSP